MNRKDCLVKEEQMELDEPVLEDVNLEDAFDVAGTGKYQVFHCILMLATLSSALLEIIGNAFILPAAACDLGLPDHLRGIITSVPNIGVILTATFWGRVADAQGRKPALIASCAAGGTLALTAAFMPNLISFVICKFAASLFLACPSSLGFAYCGELTPRRRRDISVLILNGLLMLSSSFSPIFAWGILSFNEGLHFGAVSLRPWRLLTIAYALPLLLAAAWVTQVKESPKFLMAKGKCNEALEVLKHVYARNTGLPKQRFPVASLKKSAERRETSESGYLLELTGEQGETAVALLRPPHLKWLALTGFLMFGLFSLLNGLFLFAPDTINKVMTDTADETGTLCLLMNHQNQTSSSNCDDSTSNDMFFIMVVTTALYGVVVMAASLLPVSKKTLLISMYSSVGVACLVSGLTTNRILAGAAMSALQVTSLGVGPLTAYAIHLFPTKLRGTAVGAVLLCGRLGSVVGANAAASLLAAACDLTFYGFSTMLFLCAALSFLLPKDEKTPTRRNLINS